MTFLAEKEKLILKFICKYRGPESQAVLKKNKIGEFMSLNLKTHYKATRIKNTAVMEYG